MRREGAAEWVVLRRQPPKRALIRLGGYVAVGGVVTFLTWLLFASEPATLDTGASNPAAGVPTFVALMAVAGVLLSLLPVLRQPQLALNHYGLLVRPGAFRTLLLPWVHIEEVAAVTVPDRGSGDAYLLVACDDYLGRHSGDRPGFGDRAVLREANRATEGRADGFDVAVRLADFQHEPRTILDEMARYSAEHVQVVDQLDS